MNSTPVEFRSVALLAAPSDNVAIAVRQLEPGTVVQSGSKAWALIHTVLEGHRFAVARVRSGGDLLSWGVPFGRALRDIESGEYVCNQAVLETLNERRLSITLPVRPNFEDRIEVPRLDARAFRPGRAVEAAPRPRTFQGFHRSGARGVGTRNFVVIMGTTSRTAAVAQQLADSLQPLARLHPGIDGIVAIAHTEGGGPDKPNNLPEILRALAGFIVHPNVGAILALDHGSEPVTNKLLLDYMRSNGYPVDSVLHHFLTLRGSLAAGLAEGRRIVSRWLGEVNACRRTEAPLSAIRVALQCGGSDAFSGISGNPLAGAVAHELIRHGGAAVLCETDELIGGEEYVLRNVRDLPTARAILERIAAFKERLSWHGVTAESNPSGGNRLRGLYNIALKSLGAVHKKDPRSRIEAVIDYAEPLRIPGFQFMQSPGNDLEAIAGEVAAGCNLVFFVTGNGSITNFPFVPTLKFVTTTRRHELLVHEMDINAGRYIDGESMEALTAETFELLLATASGRKTKGEQAGHSQVSLWRNWRQTDDSQLAMIREKKEPDGRPLLTAASATSGDDPVARAVFPAISVGDGSWSTERVGLILPTSLCSAQIARIATENLNRSGLGPRHGVSRFTALVHTEGCGFGGESLHRLLRRTYCGYATHPNVVAALLLEHGCEKIPNDTMRRQFEAAGIPLTRFGWASVQMDGGIEQTVNKIEKWFQETLGSKPVPEPMLTNLGALAVGMQTATVVGRVTAAAMAAVARSVLESGGSILLPEGDDLLTEPAFSVGLLGGSPICPTLAYGQTIKTPGMHVVSTETRDWSENLSGLGGCGVHVFLTIVSGNIGDGHPLIPVLQFAEVNSCDGLAPEDVDGLLSEDLKANQMLLMQRLLGVVRREYSPVTTALGLTHFQLTRGLLGVST